MTFTHNIPVIVESNREFDLAKTVNTGRVPPYPPKSVYGFTQGLRAVITGVKVVNRAYLRFLRIAQSRLLVRVMSTSVCDIPLVSPRMVPPHNDCPQSESTSVPGWGRDFYFLTDHLFSKPISINQEKRNEY